MVIREIASHLDLAPSNTWLDQCSRLVNSRRNAEPITAETFRDLTLDDLRVLNDVGGVSFLEFPPDAEPLRLDAALRQGDAALRRGGNAEEALRVALGALATRTAESNPELRDRAHGLLHEAVVLSGRDAARWVVLHRSASCK